MPQKEIPAKQTLSAVAQIFGKRVRPEWRSFKLHSEREPRQAPVQNERKYFSISELADRWRCSRGTVYNRLRTAGAQVFDPAPRGKRGRKAVSLDVVLEIEARHTKRLC